MSGFTLAEVAIVLLIVVLLTGGLLVPLSAQIESRNLTEAQRTLDVAREALLGFAVARGRLPCPATDGSGESTNTKGREAFASDDDNETTGKCADFYGGLLPAATLGLSPVDNEGFVLDPWNNRVRYGVYKGAVNGVSHALTISNGMRNATIAKLGDKDQALIYICNAAPSDTGCKDAIELTQNAPFVVYSIGSNGSKPTGGVSSDEAANPNPAGGSSDNVYVVHEPRGGAAEFDDVFTWPSIYALIDRMIAGRQLP